MDSIVRFQFGNAYQRRSHDRALLSRVYSSPCYLWDGTVNEGASLNVEDPLLEGYVVSRSPAELALGLPDGSYRVSLACYDPAAAHGPFTVEAGGAEVLREAEVPAASVSRRSFEANAVGGELRLRFVPASGKDFLLNALEVEGPPGAALHSLFRTAPPVGVPDAGELRACAQDDPVAALRRICDWLASHRRADGFMGDAWSASESHWYTTSMPVRALLAGYDILGERRYLDAAVALLDIFAGEQLPNGAWTGTFRGKPTSALPEEEVRHIMVHARQPMSDIGSVVTALGLAASYAEPPRKGRYVDAVRRFCDNWASRYQEPSGGFTDGPWGKDYLTTIYSCATAIQAAAHAIARVVSGEERYGQAADRAIAFLLPDWREDGRMTGRAPHWQVHDRKPFVMETLYFGDQWYYDEGFITTRYHTRDSALRRRIDQALHWRVFGAKGLLAALGDHVWWPLQDIWNNAKSIGMVQTLLWARAAGESTPALERALADMQRFLCTPEYARRLGVMVDDAERPAERHGIQSWAGMRMESTGFAGMTLAEMTKPGVLYLAATRGETR